MRLEDMIYRKDAALYVDIQCASCGKRMALSNARQVKVCGGGIHYLCPNSCDTKDEPCDHEWRNHCGDNMEYCKKCGEGRARA